MSQYKLEAGSGQHIGDRQEQQDRVALFVAPRAPGTMMAVLADGMGGRTGGALAAEQIINSAQQLFNEFSPGLETVETLLSRIVHEAHSIIKLSSFSSEKEPHSTLVALVISPGQATWAHVGDSRLYFFEGPNCSHCTVDHSYVEKLVAEGKLSRQEAINHPLSNVLTNALGSHQSEPTITFGQCDKLQPDTAFLLCSDGLWQHFSALEMGAAIAMNSPRSAAEMLIRKARERANGSGDNCSMAIVKLVRPSR
ncbi:PP2C family serine/threonine-protein phosphatase [Herminiimonas sp. CN]|uniref:PP2C family protein-serine/threonine phosphatase n=1 Tax=Herminiimonas sp. CN TaxID=1349818 RepID=UPI0004736699|nr:protein phosphatase 2C domain-containing protein [Herminiimonas sp. CN]